MIIIAPLPEDAPVPEFPRHSGSVALEPLDQARKASLSNYRRERQMQVVGHQAVRVNPPVILRGPEKDGFDDHAGQGGVGEGLRQVAGAESYGIHVVGVRIIEPLKADRLPPPAWDRSTAGRFVTQQLCSRSTMADRAVRRYARHILPL